MIIMWWAVVVAYFLAFTTKNPDNIFWAIVFNVLLMLYFLENKYYDKKQ